MPNSQPIPIFLGYALKDSSLPAHFIDSRITEMCSVSTCIANRPDGWIERWDFNDAGYYTTPEEALAAAPADSASSFDLFAYEFFPLRFAPDQSVVPISIADIFDMGLKPLPQGGINERFQFLGYDAVERWSDALLPTPRAFAGGFGCSPLSCNSCAPHHPTNTHCLLTSWSDAVIAARQFAKDQPEPGSYYIFGVWRSPQPLRKHA